MTITAAIVLFAVVWWMVFFCVLPMRFTSQAEAGRIEAGTPASAPENANIAKKAKLTTGIAVAIFVVLYLVIVFGNFGIADVDVFGLWKNRY
jgi:predicted secreted protein